MLMQMQIVEQSQLRCPGSFSAQQQQHQLAYLCLWDCIIRGAANQAVVAANELLALLLRGSLQEPLQAFPDAERFQEVRLRDGPMAGCRGSLCCLHTLPASL